MIPRILHRIWVGPDPLPKEFARYGESWRRHHPKWKMELWTEDRIPTDLVRPEVYERLRNPAERADILRLEVLSRFGGVYVDTDFECLRPIDPLMEGIDFCGAYYARDRVMNGVIGGRPGHPILERALRELRPATEYGLDKDGTGPSFLNELLRDYPDATIFPPEYFNPTTDAEREHAYAYHHLAGSWRGPNARKVIVLREKLAEARARIEELESGRRRTAVGLLRRGVRRQRRS
jgi:mannosyltransferase OCH1-like enzyme